MRAKLPFGCVAPNRKLTLSIEITGWRGMQKLQPKFAHPK